MHFSIKVTYWLGLVVRCKEVKIVQNPQDKKWMFVSVLGDSDDEKDNIVSEIGDVQSIELVKE